MDAFAVFKNDSEKDALAINRKINNKTSITSFMFENCKIFTMYKLLLIFFIRNFITLSGAFKAIND